MSMVFFQNVSKKLSRNAFISRSTPLFHTSFFFTCFTSFSVLHFSFFLDIFLFFLLWFDLWSIRNELTERTGKEEKKTREFVVCVSEWVKPARKKSVSGWIRHEMIIFFLFSVEIYIFFFAELDAFFQECTMLPVYSVEVAMFFSSSSRFIKIVNMWSRPMLMALCALPTRNK